MLRNALPTATPDEKLFHLVAVSSVMHTDPTSVVKILGEMENLVSSLGADPNYINHVSGWSMLTHAINIGSKPIMLKLLSLGADPNLPSATGQLPIFCALNKTPDLVLPLLESGVTLDAQCIVDGSQMTVGEVIVNMAKERDYNEILMAIEERTGQGQAASNRLPIYDVLAVKKEFDREKSESRKHFLKLLLESGYAREISKPNPRDALLPLYDKFPNFSEALDYIYRQVGLHELSSRNGFRMSPLLLTGIAGIGKTRFVRAVANALSVDAMMIGCGAISAGWVIGGASTSWSEGKPGMVLTSMRDGKTANPIIMLDEIDKLGGDPRYDGFGPLYSLLENHTAASFSDEAVGVPINCSMVSWIATANEVEVVPKPIQSRFSILEILPPTPEQMRDVARSIYNDILDANMETWGGRFSRELSEDVIDILAETTPREASRRMEDAFGVAAVSRDCAVYSLEVSDFSSNFKTKRRIGF